VPLILVPNPLPPNPKSTELFLPASQFPSARSPLQAQASHLEDCSEGAMIYEGREGRKERRAPLG